jgi:hypothetical protein
MELRYRLSPVRCVHANLRLHSAEFLAGVALIAKAFYAEIAFEAALGAALRYPWSYACCKPFMSILFI